MYHPDRTVYYRGKRGFFADTKTQDAVLRNLQVLAESAKNLSQSLREAHPDIDWRGIIGFRNILVPDYLGINMIRVWEIVEQELPKLKRQVSALLAELEGKSERGA